MKPDGQALGCSEAADPGRLIGTLIEAERRRRVEASA
jgi:hypothetical protein